MPESVNAKISIFGFKDNKKSNMIYYNSEYANKMIEIDGVG